MESKILNVFYDSSYLPYKDSERTIHFPIGGGTFAGSQNTFRIRFYPKDLVGGNDYVATTTWVLVSKRPNGTIGYQLLSDIQTDSVLGEKYIQFDLSAYYTTFKGVLKLALRGYQGEVNFVENEDDGTYSIEGTPIIGVTGTIDISINYSPMIFGDTLLPSEYDDIVAMFSNYLSLVEWKDNFVKRIIVIDSDLVDYSDYDDGQLFYRTDLKRVMQLSSGSLIHYNFGYTKHGDYNASATLNDLWEEYGDNRYFFLTRSGYNSGYLCIVSKVNTNVGRIRYRVFNLENGFLWQGTTDETDTISTVATGTADKVFATQSYIASNYYNKSETYTQAETDSAIASAISTLEQREFQKVNTTTYPTLNDFLASEGEEGYIYLYPIDPSDETKGFYQYIWENSAWLSLGTTVIDLSGYVQKTTSANKVYGTDELGAQKTYTVDDFYEGNIARRDTDGSITVPLTPTQNGHASSKKYVDDLGATKYSKTETDILLEDKANVDGNYPTMTVGSADSLTPYGENSGVEESTPFVFQSAGGSSDIGSQAQLRALRGNSVAWNQLIQKTASSKTANNVTITNNGDGSWTISTTAEGASADTYVNLGNISVPIANQKILWGFKNISSPITGVKLVDAYSGKSVGDAVTMQISTTVNGSTTWQNRLTVVSGTIITTPVKVVPQFFNLSQLGKEYTSVVNFNSDYPKSYYPYNAGTLLSCKSNGYKTVGYNAFDGELESGYYNASGNKSASANWCRSKNLIKVIAGQKYTFEQGTITGLTQKNIAEYDASGNIIQRQYSYDDNPQVFTLTNNTHYVGLGINKSGIGTNVPTTNTVSFHLTWDGSKTGYEPYETHTYALPNVELRSAGSVYDELAPDGTLIRRVGVVDLSSLNWSYNSTKQCFYAVYQTGITFTSGAELNNAISSKYTQATAYNFDANNQDKSFSINNSRLSSEQRIWVRDTSYTDAATFKTAMSGVYLFYELATPTTEQTEYTFAETTPIDDYGTQEFLYNIDIAIPVPQGNEFFYPVDYKAFVDSLGGRDDIEYAADQFVSQTQLTQALSTFLSSIQGYDATKTQTLKNVSGVFQWVDD